MTTFVNPEFFDGSHIPYKKYILMSEYRTDTFY